MADGMTKQLTGQALQHFKEALGIRGVGEIEKIEVKKIETTGGAPDPRLGKGLGLLIAVASMVTCAEFSSRQPSPSSGT